MTKALLTLLGLLLILSGYAQVPPSKLREIRGLSERFAKERAADNARESLAAAPELYNPYAINNTDTDLISDDAYARLIKKDISFIILGSQAPTPGFSLDLSNDLAVKITGHAPTKKGILTIDFSASRTNTDIPIFTEGKFTGKLSAGINYHYIPKGVLHISNEPDISFNSYSHVESAKPLLNELTYRENIRLQTALLDSIAVLITYARVSVPIGLSAVYNDPLSQNGMNLALPNAFNLSNTDIIDNMSGATRQLVFLKAASAYVSLPTSYTSAAELYAYLQKAPDWQVEKLLTNLQRLARSYNKLEEVKLDKEVARSQPYWLRRQLQWFTFSLKPVLYTVNTYENDTTRKVITTGSINFVELEAPIWYQLYDVGEKGGNLIRFGTTFVLGSNREVYRKVKYSTNDNIASYPPNSLAEQTQEEGIYVNGMNRENQLYTNYYIEYYRLPRKNFVPGFSVRIGSQKNAAFGDDTNRKTRLEAGLVLNILNKEKDQSAFTLQPYAGLTNVHREMVIDGGQERRKRFAEKLIVGIRLGLPIRRQLGVGE